MKKLEAKKKKIIAKFCAAIWPLIPIEKKYVVFDMRDETKLLPNTYVASFENATWIWYSNGDWKFQHSYIIGCTKIKSLIDYLDIYTGPPN